MNKLELIDSLIEDFAALSFRDEPKLDALRRRAEMIVRNAFGPESKYLVDLDRIHFYPMAFPAGIEAEKRAWDSGANHLSNLLKTMREEILLFDKPVSEKPQEGPVTQSDQIFLVHGHDTSMKESVARVIERLDLVPIILHEQPDEGRTVIEKFTDFADVGFAVVLLSPDDIANPRGSKPDRPSYRARQNVIFELGYFVGRLGRERVVVVHREEEGFDMPSDYAGVLYVPFDPAGRYQFDLVRELKAAGYAVDANKLLP